MEKSVDSSLFQPLAKERLTSLSSIFDSFSNFSNRFIGQEKTAFLENKIFSRFYSWMESISGKNALSVTKDEDVLLYNFYGIIHLLEKEGIINSFSLNSVRYNDAPWFYRAKLIGKEQEKGADGIPVKKMGSSFGKSPETAVSKAIGEFLERWSLATYSVKDLIPGSLQSLKKKGRPVLDMNMLFGFSEEQIAANPRYKWDENSEFMFCEGTKYSTDKKFLLPAQLVFWNYKQEKNEPILRESNTNGNGGMFSKEGAILSGLCEIVERDAFLIYWLNKISPPRIKIETVPNKGFQLIIKESERYGFKIHLLNTTADTGIPSFIVVIEDLKNGFPYFSMGGSCGFNVVAAIRQALTEAWAIYYATRADPSRYHLPQSYHPFYTKLGQDERIRLWGNPGMKEEMGFFLNGEEYDFAKIESSNRREFSSPNDELEYAVDKIERLGEGYDVYYYLSSQDVFKKVGYFSAKVIVPQMLNLYLNEVFIPLGAQRLKSVPRNIGLPSILSPNPLPHPFP